MIISARERRRNLYNSCLDGNSFDAVNKFGHLGHMIHNAGCINTTINDKIKLVSRTNSRLLRNKVYNTEI